MTDALPGGGRRAGVGWAPGTPVDVAEALGAVAFAPGAVVSVGRRGPTVQTRHQADGRVVAMKVGRALGSARERRSFTDQAGVLVHLLPLAHVAPVVDAGLSPNGSPWLVTPWYGGASVAEGLRQGPLPIAEVVEAARNAVAALAALHQVGLLHANLTPSAMLRDAYGEVWLDGVALATLTPDTASSESGLAPAHVPPEVLEGSPWSAAGDVWALGSCLHTMTAGRPPWAQAASRGTVALLLGMATGAPPGLVRTDVPSWLAALVGACLNLDAAERPDPEAVRACIEREDPSPAATFLPRSAANQPTPQQSIMDEGRPLGSSYVLIEPIGAGASGQVWRGRRRWDGGAVAVKVLRPELGADPEAVVRFLRERAALVGLEHPNLVRIFDLVAEGDTLAIVMDLIEGPNLRRLLTSRGVPPSHEGCRLLAQVASGVAFVHAAGIVHRDLKPENVLVERPGTPSAQARITDFGIARTLSGPAITRADQLLGTAAYLAPELVAGRPLSAAVDVYSLGVLAYELLSGRPPFAGEHPGAVLRAHLEVEPCRPIGLTDAVWALVWRCLAKDPSARPDAAETAAELARLASAPAGTDVAGTDVRVPTAPSWLPAPQPPAAGSPSPPPPMARSPVGWAGENLLTAAAERPLPSAPAPEGEAGRPKRWSTRTRVGALIAVAIVAAGAGVAGPLLHHGSTSGNFSGADVTVKVTATGTGAVSITWADEQNRPGFYYYVLRQDGTIASTQEQPAAGSTKLVVDGVPPGTHCFRVDAVFTGKLPAGLVAARSQPECATVP